MTATTSDGQTEMTTTSPVTTVTSGAAGRWAGRTLRAVPQSAEPSFQADSVVQVESLVASAVIVLHVIGHVKCDPVMDALDLCAWTSGVFEKKGNELSKMLFWIFEYAHYFTPVNLL